MVNKKEQVCWNCGGTSFTPIVKDSTITVVNILSAKAPLRVYICNNCKKESLLFFLSYKGNQLTIFLEEETANEAYKH